MKKKKSSKSAKKGPFDDEDSMDLSNLDQLTDDNDSDFGDDSDIEDPSALFGTKNSKKKNSAKGKKITEEKAKNGKKNPAHILVPLETEDHTNTSDNEINDISKPYDFHAVEKERQKNLEKDGKKSENNQKSSNSLSNFESDDHFPLQADHDDDLISPGFEHMLTEAIIPNFLTEIVKKLKKGYIPLAKGPYALPFLTQFVQNYIPDALGQLLAAYRHVLSKKIRDQVKNDHQNLLIDIQDYLSELLLYKETVKTEFQRQQDEIHELKEILIDFKSRDEDMKNELLLVKEQNMILKTELTDVVSVKDMAIITLRDELQFFSKESQHWSDQISRLNVQINQLKQEKMQKDVEVAILRSKKDGGCCEIM